MPDLDLNALLTAKEPSAYAGSPSADLQVARPRASPVAVDARGNEIRDKRAPPLPPARRGQGRERDQAAGGAHGAAGSPAVTLTSASPHDRR